MGRMWSPARRVLPLVLVTGLGTALLAGCGDDPEPVSAEDPGSAASSEPSADATGKGGRRGDGSGDVTASATPSEEPTSTTTVPVYVVGDTPQGQRLFREFRAVEADEPLVAAAGLLTGGSTLDPDYDSLLPTGSFADVREGGDGFEVVLEDPSWSEQPSGLSAAQARLAVQQLVHTLQGAAQAREPVRVYAEEGGDPVPLLGVSTRRGVDAAPPLRTLALVNVTMPEEATAVSGTLTATGVASSFEGTVPWEVRRGGQVVLDGFATAEGYLDRLYPWTAEVDLSRLDPGTYTFAALTADAGEGPGPTEDTKTIRVE